MHLTSLPPPRDSVRAALSACAPLAGLPPSVVYTTAEQVWMRTLAANEAVYRTGDLGDAMFVVATGTIAVRLHSVDGDAVDMAAVRTGSLFGHLELIDGGTRSTDAVAVAPSRVVVIGAATAARLFVLSPDLVLALARDMARIVRNQVDAFHDHAFYPVQARLARYLLSAAGADGRIRLEGPQALLAQRLGVARQTVSRALHGLVADGLVAVDPSGRVVTILDRPGLATVAEVRTRRSRAGLVPDPRQAGGRSGGHRARRDAEPGAAELAQLDL